MFCTFCSQEEGSQDANIEAPSKRSKVISCFNCFLLAICTDAEIWITTTVKHIIWGSRHKLLQVTSLSNNGFFDPIVFSLFCVVCE